MAKTNVYYEFREDGKRAMTLCFVCAVKKAVAIETPGEDSASITMRPDEYEFNKCMECERFILDTVTI